MSGSWLDGFFGTIRIALANALLPHRAVLNFTGNGITAVDNSLTGAIDVSVSPPTDLTNVTTDLIFQQGEGSVQIDTTTDGAAIAIGAHAGDLSLSSGSHTVVVQGPLQVNGDFITDSADVVQHTPQDAPGTTTDATSDLGVKTLTIPSNRAALVKAKLFGVVTTAGGDLGKVYVAEVDYVFTNIAGSLGEPTVSVPSLGIDIKADQSSGGVVGPTAPTLGGSTATLNVKGWAAHTMHWRAVVDVTYEPTT